jgi:hypothetical protein
LLSIVQLASACSGSDGGDDTPPTLDPKCQFKATSEKFPGYPFQTSKFASDVLPVLQASCGALGCHGPAAPANVGQGGFTVWAATDPAQCDFAQTFNAVAAIIDTTTPANSRLTAKVTGVQNPPHYVFASETDPSLLKLRDYIKAAVDQLALDGAGGAPPGGGASPFDYATFTGTIAPLFDRCATSGCHLAPGQRGFSLKAAATVTADVDANFAAITGRTTLSNPIISQVYVQATTLHGGGNSKTFNVTEAKSLLDWITAAAAKAPPGGQPSTCAPISKFNVGAFTKEIWPILKGEIDLNNGNQPNVGFACTNGICHGQVRGPGTLVMKGSDPAADLASFACFVDLRSPSRSEILACPTDTAGCRIRPHPGQDILGDGDDLNYQKILGFLFGANAEVSPFDFAFYIRNLEPLFNDPASVENGARGITCAEARECHGSASGQAPPNGSNFPIIPNAPISSAGLDRLTRNFVAASQFTNFLDATESSLFLYPTNEVANLADHKFATGRDHPGGLDFAADSAQALLILQWATGLRPDAEGFQRNWLVAGNFFANDIDDVVSEDATSPSIFDPHAGSFSFPKDGWDGFFSASAEVDLNIPVPGNGVDHVVYATSYVLNTDDRDLEVDVVVESDNELEIIIDGGAVSGGKKGPGAGIAIATMRLKAAGSEGAASQVTIKIFQRAVEPTITFTAKFVDSQDQALTDATGELVITLGKNGGL